MRKTILVALIFFPALLFSNSKTDSLIQLLPKLSGKEKIQALLELSDELKSTDSRLALEYAETGLELSQKQELIDLESRLYKTIGSIYSYQNNYEKSNANYEKALELYRKTENANGIARVYANLGVNSSDLGEYDTAMQYFEKSRLLFETLEEAFFVFWVDLRIANLHYRKGNFDEALEHYQILLDTAKSRKLTTSEATVLSNIGRVHLKKGAYAKALELYYQTLDVYDSLGNTYSQANLLNDIGIVYQNLGFYEEAIKTYRESYEGFEFIDNQRGMGMINANLASTYNEMEEFDSGYVCIKKALKIYEDLGVKSNGNLLITLGQILTNTDKADSADLIVNRAIKVFAKLGQAEGVTRAKVQLGKIYLTQNKLEESEKIGLESLADLEVSRNLDWLKMNCELLAEVYERKGNPEKALYYKDRTISITDSLSGNEQMSEIRRLEVERFLKQNRKSAIIENENTVNHSRQKLGFAAVIFALLSGVWWYFKKQKSTQTEAAENSDSQLKRELEKKKLEVTFLNLSMIQKDEFLQKLKAELKAFSKNNPQNQAVKELVHSIHLNDVKRKDWENFKLAFEQIFPDFFDELYARFPGLTTKELRHCALIRLKIPPHDAAQIMGISTDSVHKARYRLRKKFGLEHSEKLEEFLLTVKKQEN